MDVARIRKGPRHDLFIGSKMEVRRWEMGVGGRWKVEGELRGRLKIGDGRWGIGGRGRREVSFAEDERSEMGDGVGWKVKGRRWKEKAGFEIL